MLYWFAEYVFVVVVAAVVVFHHLTDVVQIWEGKLHFSRVSDRAADNTEALMPYVYRPASAKKEQFHIQGYIRKFT